MQKRQINFGNLSSGIFVPVLLIAVLAAAYFMLYPRYLSVQESQANLAAKQAVVLERQGSLSSITALKKELEPKQASLAPVDKALPLSPSLPELLADTEYLVNLSGLGPEGITFQPVAEALRPDGQPRELPGKLGMIAVSVSV